MTKHAHVVFRHPLQESEMSQQYTPIAQQQKSKTPAAPAAPSAPLPIDPSLLRQISGGTTELTPKGGW
jgi:hypothetical protein